MMISQQQKNLAEQAGIAVSHYSIDGELIYASPETINYFTALLQPAKKSSQVKTDGVWVATENTDFEVDLTRFFSELPVKLNYQLFDEHHFCVREAEVVQGATTLSFSALAAGYYRLHLIGAEQSLRICLLISPPQVYQPLHLQTDKVRGISVQLYSLHSERNWGVGDFADLRYLIESAVKFGADFVGINPLHQLYTAAPEFTNLQVLTDDILQQKYDDRVEDKQALLDTLYRDGYLPPNYEGDERSFKQSDSSVSGGRRKPLNRGSMRKFNWAGSFL